jgi:hypothetical protein
MALKKPKTRKPFGKITAISDAQHVALVEKLWNFNFPAMCNMQT